MSYLLDTDSISNTMKKQPSSSLLQRMAAVPDEDQFMSAISVGEMIYGAYKNPGKEVILGRLEREIFPSFSILPFDEEAARVYGRVRRELEEKGTPLDEADLRIAAIALSRGMTLVTGNIRHFARIPDLVIEDWLEP